MNIGRNTKFFAQALNFGAELIAPDRTRFRLWAPSQFAVQLELADGTTLPMQAQDDGWFEVTADCGAGMAYHYRLDDDLAVPDPAARAQLDDVHGDSLVVDPHAYRWQHGDWRGRPWTETVLYEVHVGSYGGYEGLRQRLPELAALGITAIELMPIAEFPGARNWGYDGVLPFAPDRAYGSPEQLKALIDAAHGLGLMVFLDVVYNHFGPDGNYLNAYAPLFFRLDAPTLWGPAIDFRQQPVRDFFTSNALYWLCEYRFDGFRFDSAHAIRDPDWLDEVAVAARRACAGRQIHLLLENDANQAALLWRDGDHGYDAQWNDDAHHALHVLLTGEQEGYYLDYAEAPIAQLARCLSEGFAFQGEFSQTHGAPRGSSSIGLPPHAFVLFLQNHDQIGNRAFGERLTTLCPPQALHAAQTLVLLAPQIPLLFMGEEWDSRQPFLFFTGHHEALAAQVREGRRREFSRFTAFADPERVAAIPDPNDPQTFTASIPDFSTASTPQGMARRGEIATLLKLRRTQIVPALAGSCSLGAQLLSAAALCARWRLGDGRELVLASNFGTTPVPFAAHVAAVGTTLLHASAEYQASDTTLPPHCTVAFIGGGAVR